MGAIHEDRKLTFKYPFFLCYFEKNLAKIHEGSVSFMRFFNSPQGDLFWKDSKLPLCPLKGVRCAVKNINPLKLLSRCEITLQIMLRLKTLFQNTLRLTLQTSLSVVGFSQEVRSRKRSCFLSIPSS